MSECTNFLFQIQTLNPLQMLFSLSLPLIETEVKHNIWHYSEYTEDMKLTLVR
jgi:hypothetical protein